MTARISAIYRHVPKDIGARLHRCLDAAADTTGGPVRVFFRADDVAVPGANFKHVIDLFAGHGIPLNLAVVPAWLSTARWQALAGIAKATPDLWCWHQHGWRHANHARSGKKQEFGADRARHEIEKDLKRGQQRLAQTMKAQFYPVFTPPWNRCGHRTLDLVQKLGFYAVSRSCGSLPPVPRGLEDFSVGVDLHTMRIAHPALGWDRLLADLATNIATGLCGIMIHHQRMNDAAFGFLDMLLSAVGRHRKLSPVGFRDLVS